ncbi:DUF5642 family protein [Rhodococcus sp. NPDC055112]
MGACLGVAGCSSSVDGMASPVAAAGPSSSAAADGTGEDGRVDATLESMLLTPTDFPAPYQAIVLPPHAVSQAAADLDGIPPGAKVDPAGCKPPAQDYGPDGTAMIVGTDNANRSTISVELMRSDLPLDKRIGEIERCLEVTTTKDGAEAVVRTEILPAPPLNADDTIAMRQTVTSGKGAGKVTQSMLTLVAQIDDVRVSATYMSFGDGKPDTVVLDQVFTEAVQRVNAA